jgi:protein-S-isoprenylcysteine O-methyltransferase Ste14
MGDGPGAAAYAGRLFQGVALAVLWSVLVLPAVGDRAWAIALLVLGTALVLVAMRLLGERWWPTRRAGDAANLVWAVTLPVAGVALVLSLL